MSLLSDNIIPGNQGKVFGTNAENRDDLLLIQKKVLELEGIEDVIFDFEIFPREFVVHTSTLVEIWKVENCVKKLGFHAIPKGFFQV